jgi:hypothetical protein
MLKLDKYQSKTGKNFWYKDNGGSVLMVAHADTVKRPGVFQPVKGREDTRIFSPTWDDRIGPYVYTYLLKMGIKIDFLLTEDEEQRKSTALWFDAPKKYNWMFMFDRKGTDAVCYQYTDSKLSYRLGKHNFNVGIGSYSCIKDLEHLGISGINFGSGYHDNHTEWAYLSVKELRRNLGKFLDFYREFKDVRMLHDVGYERFAEDVTRHTYEMNREDQEENFMIPALSVGKGLQDPYKLTHGSEDELFWERAEKVRNRDIEDANYMEIADEKPDFAFDDSGELKKVQQEILEESKAMMQVDEHGVLRGLRTDRNVYKLYWPLEMLNKHDPSTKNILQNTFGCKYLYDVVKLSPVRLCAQRNLTFAQAQALHEWVVGIGFNMPYNLQSFKTPELWFHEEKASTYNRRKMIMSNLPDKMRKDVAKKAKKFLASKKAKKFNAKYEKPNQVDQDKIQKLELEVRRLEKKYDETTNKGWKARWLAKLRAAQEDLAQFKCKVKGIFKKKQDGPIQGPKNRPGSISQDYKFKSSKYIQLFPLPEGKGNYEELIVTARELMKSGYDLEVMFTCGNCKRNIVFDVEKNNQLPKVCEDCEADLNSDEHFMLSQEAEELVPSNTILTKVQLKKEKDDDSVFNYTGKPNGEQGIDKYSWSSNGPVGFVRTDS